MKQDAIIAVTNIARQIRDHSNEMAELDIDYIIGCLKDINGYLQPNEMPTVQEILDGARL